MNDIVIIGNITIIIIIISIIIMTMMMTHSLPGRWLSNTRCYCCAHVTHTHHTRGLKVTSSEKTYIV